MAQLAPSFFVRPTPAIPLGGSTPEMADALAQIGVVGPEDQLLLLVVGGAPRVVAELEKLVLTRIGLSVGLVSVGSGEDPCGRLAAGGFDGAIVFDDLVGRATLRGIQERKLALATLCIVERAEPSKRAAIRAQMRHEGALSCIFADELTGALVEAAVIHAVELQRSLRQNALRQSSSGSASRPRLELLHRLRAAQARAQVEPNYRFRVVHVDAAMLTQEGLDPAIVETIEDELVSGLDAELGDGTVLRLARGSYGLLLEEARDDSSGLEHIERVGALVQRPFSAGGRPISLDAGVGVVLGATDAPPEQLLARAIAASRARSASVDPQELASLSGERPRAAPSSAPSVELALRRALDRGEFSLCYQPIVELESQRLLGFEALIRLNDGADGVVLAAEDFIGEAERSALIVPMGYWALETAIRQMNEWDRDFELAAEVSMSINLSARQCQDTTLLARIRSLLMTTGCDPGLIRVEVARDALVREGARTRALLLGLAETGVGIWIEDFGFGQLSEEDLRALPVTALKIDKDLVHAIDGTPAATERVKHVVDTARSLRVPVMAEGIESPVQANVLRWLGCSIGQGFLYARPLAVGDAFAYLAARR